MRNDPFWVRVVSDSRLLDIASTFLRGPDGIALFSSHYFCKAAGTGQRVLWHQDGSYWPLRPVTVTTLWVCVDTSDRENGCLRVFPRSHLEDLAPLVADTADTEQNVLGACTHDDSHLARLTERFGPPLDLELQPGDISLHHPNLIHGSEPNRSTRRRTGLTIRYIPATTAVLNPEQPVMMLRGEAATGVNNDYRSWPPFRGAGQDFDFSGSAEWNEQRRVVREADEEWFRLDAHALRRQCLDDTLAFVRALGGVPGEKKTKQQNAVGLTSHMRACMRACVHACMRACVHACMRACVHACMRACACVHACVRACMRTCVRACMAGLRDAHVQTCTHVNMHSNTYVHAHVHACIHTCMHEYRQRKQGMKGCGGEREGGRGREREFIRKQCPKWKRQIHSHARMQTGA